MTSIGILQIGIYFLILLAITKPVGLYMARVFNGERTFLHPVLRWLEVLIYRLSGVREDAEQRWTQYSGALLSFSVFGFLLAYVIQRAQAYLPLNPQNFGTPVMTPDLAFNTAVSFLTNTNWQSYSGESTLSYFVQMAALTVQNFVSGASGVAIAIAVARGFARQQMKTIGNFWVDLTRATLYVLLPLSLVGALFLCSQGVIQNLHPNTKAATVEGAAQIIPQGPVASQEAIKMVGTNGGGFFGANSSHPFENPTPLSNFVQMLMIFVIPAGLMYTFGKMVGDTRQGWALFAAASVMFLVGVFVCYPAEQGGNPLLAKLGIQTTASATQAGGNMEGKETRFGIASSTLFATITTDASCGAINGQHDSFLAVFIAGLMVGRTPEYIGKKIEQKEVKMAMLAVIATAASILVFTSISSVVPFAKNGYWNSSGAAITNLTNGGPHGFAEILYAYTSGTANNGSAFGGINANTPWYNLTLGLAMLIGRFLFLLPLLAAAGNLAGKKKVATTSGTFPTHGALFVGLLVGTVVIVGALTFFPALSLGPIVEHYLMHQGKLF
jgi:K+-transporting ATPase ATPase A chain